MTRSPVPGALVVSLDFELHWGICRHTPLTDGQRSRFMDAREAVARLLEIFAAYEVAATWATVGRLFADGRDDLERYEPARRSPSRRDRGWPASRVGRREEDDPFHFAPSLIERIRATPRQELASHSFSHYDCGDEDADVADFEEDLRAAQRIARAKGFGSMRSFVFPRNRSRTEFVRVLPSVGIEVYRGNPPGFPWRLDAGGRARAGVRRAVRLLDAYAPVAGDDTIAWDSIVEPGGLVDVRASRFLRPHDPRFDALERLQRRRIADSLGRAARRGRLFHLWWHPHNFGTHLERNLGTVRAILDEFARNRDRDGMRSLTMGDAADHALGRRDAGAGRRSGGR